MKYRPLGNTGITVSEIGFGTWGIGGLTEGATSYGPTDDAESVRALQTAFAHGITFYDTSNIYGNGHSEMLIGETFRTMRHKVVIASKVGFTKHGGPHDLSPSYIQKCLEGSLKRLQSDYIDLYQLHSPPLHLVTNEVLETLEMFRAQGKIRAYGFSVKNPHDGIAAIASLGFRTVQANFSMMDQRIITNGVLQLAEEKSVGIIGRTPLNFGFLAGGTHGTAFDPRDHRSNWPEAQLERWTKSSNLFSQLIENKKRTHAQLALQFCLGFEAISTVIPGILHPNEAEENAQASELPPLDKDDLLAIGIINQENTFFEPADKEQ